MLVKCTNNRFEKIQSSWIKSNFDTYKDIHKRLTLNKLYVVYGMQMATETFVYVAGEDDIYGYPAAFPLELFRVMDNRLSRHFCWGDASTLATNNNGVLRAYGMLGLKEWTEDPNFWLGIRNGDKVRRDAFLNFKEQVDLEYFNPTLLEDWGYNISIIGNDMCMCSSCCDSWHASRENEMLRCPSCQRVFKSPFH